MRAYGGACAEALDLAELVEVVIKRRVTVVHDYELSATISSVVAASGFQATESDYAEHVTLAFDVPEGAVDGFVAALKERTADRARVEIAPSEE